MSDFKNIQQRESGLKRELGPKQMSMIALGGAIGTGLFLGSKFAIGFAGPSVIISYAIGGLIALLLMGALAEMTVAHATSGSFGAYAEFYVGPLIGFLVRYLYWSCIVLAVGTEVTAIGEYMQFWFADVPSWLWIVLFSGVLIGVNMFNVKAFGTMEYWFSTIKVFAIVAFIVMAAYVVFGSGNPDYGFHNYTGRWRILPEWFLSGMWFAVIVSIFSYLSIEMIAIAAGEAENPAVAVKKAFRVTIVRLFVFYIATLALILAIAPMDKILSGGSPFVTVMQVVKIPGADSVLNFVVIIAALSAMNSQLYVSSRMMFSLSRAGDAPAILGKVRANGSPVNALLLSTSGIAVATIVLRALSRAGIHLDDLAVDVRGNGDVAADLRDALVLSQADGERRTDTFLHDSVLPGGDDTGRCPHGRDPRHDVVGRGFQDDLGVRGTVCPRRDRHLLLHPLTSGTESSGDG